jgi:hypothetical protein
MKLSVGLANGAILVYEGTYEELVKIGEKLVLEHGPMIVNVKDAEKLNGRKFHLSSKGWTEQNVKALLAHLYGDQAKLLKFLVERGGNATYPEIKKEMGYGGQSLSGILSPITRNAQKATGDPFARLIDWRPDQSGTKRIYFVHPEALPHLKDAMKKA